MLKQGNDQIQIAVRTADAVVCVGAFFAAYLLRNSALFVSEGGIGGIESVSWMLGTSILLHVVLYPVLKFYESLRLKSILDIIWMVLKSAVIEFFVLGSLIFLIQAKSTSRVFFGLFILINYALILAEKLTARVLLSSIRRRGYNFRQVLIVGTGPNAERIIQSLRRNVHWGYKPCGLLQEEAVQGREPIHGVEVWGQLVNLESVLKSHAVDEVFFAMERIDPREVTPYLSLCERLGIPSRFSFPVFDLPNSKLAYSTLDNVPVLTFYTTLRSPFEDFIKRAIDIAASVVGLLITGLFFPWISWRIRKESPGPVIFKQLRVGENGRVFKCYKFRTMNVGADGQKAELLKNNFMEGPLFKIDNDPRVFPFGAFLRKTSLDELPQFFNIFRGDMSLVGTRPPTPDEVREYETHYRRRLSIRPGLTGLWQVSGRNEIRKFEDVLKLDLQYIDHWSLGLDLKIIGRTVLMLISRRGAY
jgi:exopolysaccharide biosynthesis polyprenyl glycosylphosphotransferase